MALLLVKTKSYLLHKVLNSSFLCCNIAAFSPFKGANLRAMAYCGKSFLISAIGRFQLFGLILIFFSCPAETFGVISPVAESCRKATKPSGWGMRTDGHQRLGAGKGAPPLPSSPVLSASQ